MIPRIDLIRDYNRYKEEYLQAINEVCDNTAFSGGQYAERFDREFAEYCNVKYASGVNNGTSALHLAMLALGIGGGDEVIVPANTYIATAWGVSYTGARPVFVDCTEDTWEINPSKIEEKITANTKAIVGVHLYGQPFAFDKVKKVADKYSLYIIEDCAQAHGATYRGRKVGGLGDIGCFSFYPGKNLYAFGEGGSITTNNADYIRHVNRLKNQGCDVRYYHDEIGYNMRMEGVQGAVLSVGLKHLDDWTKKRREIGSFFLEHINNPYLKMQAHPEDTEAVFHLFVVCVDNRNAFMEYMRQNGVCCDIHYPVPCHLQKAYAFLKYKKGDCPNSEYLAEHCVTLPLFPEMREDEVFKVTELCNAYPGRKLV